MQTIHDAGLRIVQLLYLKLFLPFLSPDVCIFQVLYIFSPSSSVTRLFVELFQSINYPRDVHRIGCLVFLSGRASYGTIYAAQQGSARSNILTVQLCPF